MKTNKNAIYSIKVLKWFEHNPTAKKSYKKSMIEHGLIGDAKINAMPLSHKWLFINLLLICGDHANDTITLTHRQVNDILTTKEGANNALAKLQEFQLVSFEEISSFKELKEKKEIEVKEPEKKLSEKKIVPEPIKISEHFFYKFLIEKMETNDTGLANLIPKIDRAFVNEAGFNEWTSLVVANENFKNADHTKQKKYFLKALKDELRDRGCL